MGWADSEAIYTKALLWLHVYNPQRNTIYNRARPFLNTLFVINEINKSTWNTDGILWHEFWAFVLSMKDCNYEETAKAILEYRERCGFKRNKVDLEDFLYKDRKVNEIWFDSIFKDYADDVFRKFDMTWLLLKSWFWDSTYIRFNKFNQSKIDLILQEFEWYKFEKFETPEDYVNYLSDISLPWEQSDKVKKEIINKQKEELKVEVNTKLSYDDQLKELNHLYNRKVFKDYIDKSKISIDEIKQELLILCSNPKVKSEYEDIPEPVRLEWFIALLTANIYWSSYVSPNLLFDSDWKPKSFAPWGMADIEFITEDLYCLIEVTLIKDYKQQVNSETTSISSHLDELETNKRKCSLLLAPYIHQRVVRYFQFESKNYGLSILALSILLYLKNIENHKTIADFIRMVDNYTKKLNSLEDKLYSDMVNSVSEYYK